jgi:integrase/recombinase XerD
MLVLLGSSVLPEEEVMRKDCWRAGDGPLVPFAEMFRANLIEAGHPPGSLKHYFILMGQLDRWMSTEGLAAEDLSSATAERFVVARSMRGYKPVTTASLAPLIDCLRGHRVIVAERLAEPTPVECLLADYRRHLVHDRGLAATTVRRYMNFARRFLGARAGRTGSPTGAEGLTSADVNVFMLDAAARLVVESAKREAADLRALLRFLYLSDRLGTDLGAAMPPVAVWRGRSLPPTMRPDEVDTLIAVCDRATMRGLRDRAVLVLMARLGLRAGEVAALELDDIDWRAGEIVVRGKARRRDRLPLPAEVGDALVEYLSHVRPRSPWRQVFLTLYAPFHPLHPSTLTTLVYKACEHAGLPRVGGHQLRHALATDMLRQGGDLLEIAQVLRQSDLGTTAGYAKVDRAALRSVARAWPGVSA